MNKDKDKGFRLEKQLSIGVLRKRCSGNMLQIYRRTPMLKSHFKKVALVGVLTGFSPVNLLHIFRITFGTLLEDCV